MKFEINEAERAVIAEWVKKLPGGLPSGDVTGFRGMKYTFMPTGIGTFVTVHCGDHQLDLWEAIDYEV